MKNSMRVKYLKKFFSPLTGRLTVIGKEDWVPKNQFWFKRVLQNDCEEIKSKAKVEPKTQAVVSKKGSK